MGATTRRRWWLLLGTVVLGAACGGEARRAGVERELRIHLLDRLDAAELQDQSRDAPRLVRYTLGFDERPALAQFPPSAIRFPDLPSGPGARFVASPVMAPASWAAPTDGVELEVLCRDQTERWQRLSRTTISPATRADDRRWHEVDVGLERCSAPTTELELRSSCGAWGNCTADWAGWGDPRVERRSTLVLRPRRLVLLVSIDTLRPDHLSLYGWDRATSPGLDALASEAVVFTRAVSASPWTIPSHATMLTSTGPRVHGAGAESPISPSTPAVAEAFERAGWQTAAFVDTPYLRRELGFGRGFAHYDDEPPPPGSFRRGARVVGQRLLRWLVAADERPAFVWWHLMDVHGPYGSPAPFGGRFRSTVDCPENGRDELVRMGEMRYHDYLKLDRYSCLDDLVAGYDEGIAAVDAEVEALLDLLRASGVFDEALVVVTSDHGESLFDHGLWVGHGLFLTDDEVRVPLLVKRPGGVDAGSRRSDLVGLIDLAPTLLELAGLPPEPWMEGRNLFPSRHEPPLAPPVLFGYSGNIEGSSVRTPDFTYLSAPRVDAATILERHLRGPGAPPDALLQMTRELLASVHPDGVDDPARLDRLRSLLALHVARSAEHRASSAPDRALSPEARKRLEALGYVH